MKVIIDTNFILSCLKKKVQIFEEIDNLNLDAVVPEQVVNELKKLKENKKKSYADRELCNLALQLIKHKKIKKIKLSKVYVDSGILDYVKKNKYVCIATLDRELKRRLVGVRFVIIRKRKLEIE